MSEKFKLNRKIGIQNTFYTKCINVKIDSIGPLIILRSIVTHKNIFLWVSDSEFGVQVVSQDNVLDNAVGMTAGNI